MGSFQRLLIASLLFVISINILQFSLLNNSDSPTNELARKTDTTPPGVSSDTREVLSSTVNAPRLSISGDKEYGGGGVISLASTSEPKVLISSYNVSGQAEVTLYKASLEQMLTYLQHDDKTKQISPEVSVSDSDLVTKTNFELKKGYSEPSELSLPLSESGIWFMKIKIGEVEDSAFIVRSRTGVAIREAERDIVFWGYDFATRRSVSDGNVLLYDLENKVSQISIVSFNADGIATSSISDNADVAIVKRGDDVSMVPINMLYLNSGYNYTSFSPQELAYNFFIFTDRPLYAPGDTIFFKSIIRRDNDGIYSVAGGSARVSLYKGWGEESKVVSEYNVSISPFGTVSGEFSIPADISTGYYSLSVDLDPESDAYGLQSAISVQIENFRKPEYSIDVEAGDREYIAGDSASFTIAGRYFFGQPLSGKKVKYKVYISDFYEYSYLSSIRASLSDDYRYGYSGGKIAAEGEVELDKTGQATVSFDTESSGKSQVLSVEASYMDETGNPSFARKNLLLYPGEYGIYLEKPIWGKQVNEEFELPIVLSGYEGANVGGRKVSANVGLTRWVEYSDENFKYPQYRMEEKDIGTIEGVTDQSGKVVFIQKPLETGSYEYLFESVDGRGNTVKKEIYIYVSENGGYYYGETYDRELTVHTDSDLYRHTDALTYTIVSQIPDRDVFVSFDRGYSHRYKVVHIDGNKGAFEEQLRETDMPNIYITVSGFSNSAFHYISKNVAISAEPKALNISITPDKKEYKPGDNVTLNVSTTDIGGNPVSADVAVWAVDKAIFELVDQPPLKVFEDFWSERYLSTSWAHSLLGINVEPAAEKGGGCFVGDTLIEMADGSQKRIADIKNADVVLSKDFDTGTLAEGKVFNAHSTEVSGYLLINDELKVTPEHILNVNGTWRSASSIQIGDYLIDKDGENQMVSSVEWVLGKETVYNFDVEGEHNFFAGGFWVHNQKGEPRETFEDTAYWNPSVQTDSNGHAQVTFRLPDNLTTWVLAGLGATMDTKVGKTTNEIVVSKDVVVRPILPNILRTGDRAVLSSLVQNFRNDPLEIGVSFEAKGVELLSGGDTTESIGAGELKQYFWEVEAVDSGEAQITYSAISSSDNDIGDVVKQTLPVREFGFEDVYGDTGENTTDYQIDLKGDSKLSESSISLNLTTTLLGSLPQGMSYLVGYPYGCVEQTTSRFVPAVIAKANGSLFEQTLKDEKVDTYIEQGISRLKTLQSADGGWAWWGNGKSNAFITAYVVEYLLKAEELGFKVEEEVFTNVRKYLNEQSFSDRGDEVSRIYALSLLGEEGGKKEITNFDGLTPDIVALAVTVNARNGVSDFEKNGLNKLISLSKEQGGGIYWEPGVVNSFGSVDASTALSLRAIVASGGPTEIATKAARFLLSNKNNSFWSNTFGTAQVVQAATDFANYNRELTPNMTYTVILDGEEVRKGKIHETQFGSLDIEISPEDIKEGGSTLSIVKEGEGQLYSSLAISEYRTDKDVDSVSNGISITREYVNKTKPDYSLGVGDTVEVKLTVDGLSNSVPYGVIEDRLPAGMVPVNTRFENEQFIDENNQYYYGQEYLPDGVVFSIYRVRPGKHTYTYMARVISEGDFTAPPARVSLMYSPEIYGRSEASKVRIEREGKLLPRKALENQLQKFQDMTTSKSVLLVLFIVLVALVTILWYLKRHRKQDDQPPTIIEPPQTYTS